MKDTAHADGRSGRTDSRDNPEQFPTEKPNLHELHEEEMNVDSIPLEDLRIEQREEKKRDGTEKHRSSSERKYHTGFED